MSYTIINKGNAENDIQCRIFAEHYDWLLAGLQVQEHVVSGGAVTAQGSPDMTVAVAKAAIISQSGNVQAVAAGNVTITTADATNPRLDLVVITSAGAKAARAGTAAQFPVPPARSAGDVPLALVYIPAAATQITSARLTDMRVIINRNVILNKIATPVVLNNLSTIQTLLSQVIPNGLFVAGRILRVTMGGTYLFNSGTPTLILSISYGGTVMFADVTVASTTDADRGAWFLDIMIAAQSNTVQNLSGLMSVQSVGAKTAPTSGQAGDIGAAGANIITPIAGTAAVDSDAADRTLLIQETMNVANAADEVAMTACLVELF